MPYHYVATNQKATAVTHSLICNLTGPTTGAPRNLIVVKGSILEVYEIKESSLELLHEHTINGRIAVLKDFRPAGENLDRLFICTEKYQYFVLCYHTEDRCLYTQTQGTARDPEGQPPELGQRGDMDPQCRLVGLHLYHGLLKVIPMDTRGTLKTPFNVLLDVSMDVLDMCFLHGYPSATVAVLYSAGDACHVKTYSISVKDKSIANGPWHQPNVSPEASMMVAVPGQMGGILIFSSQDIMYHRGNFFKTLPIDSNSHITAVTQLSEDGTRWLLGDNTGRIMSLVLSTNQSNSVQSLHLEVIGQSSWPESLAVLNGNTIFLGSRIGDSFLLRLGGDDGMTDEVSSDGLTVLDTFPNLGPIVDFVVTDMDRQGQGQIVTCSGAGKDGTIRVVRNGIGLTEQASIEMPGIKGMWSLKPAGSPFDKFLVQSFIGQTRILGIEDEELGETQINGFAAGETIHCANIGDSSIVQVTRDAVVLVSSESLERLGDSWIPSSPITVACSTDDTIAICSGKTLTLLVASEAGAHMDDPFGSKVPNMTNVAGSLQVKATKELEHEAACLDVSPAVDSLPQLVVVGLWTDMSVLLLDKSTLDVLQVCALGGDTQARSVRLCSFNQSKQTLFVGLGDGSLLTFPFITEEEREKAMEDGETTSQLVGTQKRTVLGAQPILLTRFSAEDGSPCVFASCDRPNVIYVSPQGKLMYSSVNCADVSYMTPFHCEPFPNCLALFTSQTELTIGNIDAIQKLHIQTIHLDAQPRRITHLPALGALAVCTLSTESANGNDSSSVQLFDHSTLDRMTSLELDDDEMATSLACCHFQGDETEYLVVGTAYVNSSETEYEPTRGRVLVLSVLDSTPIDTHEPKIERKLHIVAEVLTDGAVHAVKPFKGRAVVGIRSMVQVLKLVRKGVMSDLTDEDTPSASSAQQLGGIPSLEVECAHTGHILALHLACHENFVAVGDLMSSVSVLEYQPTEGKFMEAAKDYESNWMTAVALLSDQVAVGAEHMGNLFAVQRNTEATTEEERRRLRTAGQFHLGDMVNKFEHGSLVMQPLEDSASTASSTSMQLDAAESTPQQSPAALPSSRNVEPLLFATVGGSIGTILPLTDGQYDFFRSLQRALNKVTKPLGGLNHSNWRAFENDRRMVDYTHFVDGDSVESFFDLSKTQAMKVVDMLVDDGWTVEKPPQGQEEKSATTTAEPAEEQAKITHEEVVRRIETISRRH